MSKILFVTGTDTNVGKTVVSSLIASELNLKGWNVAVVKPVETGCQLRDDDTLVASDALILKEASNTKQSSEDVCPLRFSAAVAPAVAIKQSGAEVSIADIIRHIERQSQECDILIVEGAGGLMVPIIDDYTFADLAYDMNMSTILVAGSKLGVLNAASLSFEVMNMRNLNVLGYIVNDLHQNTATEDEAIYTNRDALKQIARRYEMPEIGYLPNLGEDINQLSIENQENVESLVNIIKSSLCHD